MKETCIKCVYFSSCEDTTDNCENEGCACFMPLDTEQ